MAAMVQIFKSKIMRPVSGTSTGDYRVYHRFDAAVPLPDYIVAQSLPSLPSRDNVRVQFPAVNDFKLMSDAQKYVVGEREPAEDSSFGDGGGTIYYQ
jgi:hypothetical protein